MTFRKKNPLLMNSLIMSTLFLNGTTQWQEPAKLPTVSECSDTKPTAAIHYCSVESLDLPTHRKHYSGTKSPYIHITVSTCFLDDYSDSALSLNMKLQLRDFLECEVSPDFF